MKNGTETKYFLNRKKFKRSETSYKNGKKHGKDTCWRRPGEKMYEHTYKNGVLDGPCVYYDKHGNVIEKYSCTNGDPDPSYTDYYETEIIEFGGVDVVKAGKRKSQRKLLKDGSYSYNEWYKDGKTKKRKGKYDKDNLMTGLWSEWYFDGRKLSEGVFDKGNGQVKIYKPYGKDIVECIGDYVNNHKEGKWNVYDYIKGKGVLKRFQDSDNVVKRYDNGVLAFIEKERAYSGGNKTGKWSKYLYPGVKEFEGNYKNGEKDGLWTYYLLDLAFDEDLEQGIYEEKIESRGSYINGEKHGVWYYSEEYGERGEPVSTLYNNGKFVKEVPLVHG